MMEYIFINFMQIRRARLKFWNPLVRGGGTRLFLLCVVWCYWPQYNCVFAFLVVSFQFSGLSYLLQWFDDIVMLWHLTITLTFWNFIRWFNVLSSVGFYYLPVEGNLLMFYWWCHLITYRRYPDLIIESHVNLCTVNQSTVTNMVSLTVTRRLWIFISLATLYHFWLHLIELSIRWCCRHKFLNLYFCDYFAITVILSLCWGL